MPSSWATVRRGTANRSSRSHRRVASAWGEKIHLALRRGRGQGMQQINGGAYCSAILFKFPSPASKCFPINPFTPTNSSITFMT
jgi:hypothetical protein